MPTTRDRIVELIRVPAKQLQPHPHNWRVHPPSQRSALAGVLREIGYADALIARRLPDGSLELIDGHLRAETTPDAEVPVLVVDLDEREAALLLAVHDPLAAMAESDEAQLRQTLDGIEARQIELDKILGSLPADESQLSRRLHQNDREPTLTDQYHVLIECRDEAEQRALFERMRREGFKCRLTIL